METRIDDRAFFAYMSACKHVGQGELDEVMASESAMVHEGRISDDNAKHAPRPGPSTFDNTNEEGSSSM